MPSVPLVTKCSIDWYTASGVSGRGLERRSPFIHVTLTGLGERSHRAPSPLLRALPSFVGLRITLGAGAHQGLVKTR